MLVTGSVLLSRAVDRRLVEPLAREAGHADEVAGVDGVGVVSGEDEDARQMSLGRHRRWVPGGRSPESLAAAPSKSPTTTPCGRDVAGDRGVAGRALDVVDRRVRVVADVAVVVKLTV